MEKYKIDATSPRAIMLAEKIANADNGDALYCMDYGLSGGASKAHDIPTTSNIFAGANLAMLLDPKGAITCGEINGGIVKLRTNNNNKSPLVLQLSESPPRLADRKNQAERLFQNQVSLAAATEKGWGWAIIGTRREEVELGVASNGETIYATVEWFLVGAGRDETAVHLLNQAQSRLLGRAWDEQRLAA